MSFKHYVLLSIGLFIAGVAVGFLAPGVIAGLLAGNLSQLRDLAAALGPFKISTAVFIFFKNLTAALLSFTFSPVLLLLPILTLTLNGALISFVAIAGVQQRSLGFVLTAILPHGVIELTAVILAEAAALSFGVSAILALFSETRRRRFVPDLKRNLRHLVIACILLVPAALIETFITPRLIGR